MYCIQNTTKVSLFFEISFKKRRHKTFLKQSIIKNLKFRKIELNNLNNFELIFAESVDQFQRPRLPCEDSE